MKIIVVGCGNVGSMLARTLSAEGHNITVIDSNPVTVKALSNELDIMAITGNGSTLEVLVDAGAENADLLIAVTDSDERNLLCCLISKKCGTKNTIARVRNPEYKNEIEFIKNDLGLSLSVNPELFAADEIARLVKFPTAIEIDAFAGGRVELLKFEVSKDSPICGLVLKNLKKDLNSEVLICIVERGSETLIPTGDFTLLEGDRVSFIASGRKAVEFFKAIKMSQGKIRAVIIVGGGETSFYLAKKLLASGVQVKIIEKDKRRCEELADVLSDAVIINGDGADKGLLGEEGLDRADAFVSLSNHDEENIMMSIYAKKVNPRIKIITKVHRNAYDEIINDLKIGSIINPKLLAAENIIKYVRAMSNTGDSNMETLYRLNDGRAEAMEFTVRETSDLVDRPLSELKLKKNVIVASIVRKGQIETPKGSSVIKVGDKVIIVTTNTGFDDIKDILA